MASARQARAPGSDAPMANTTALPRLGELSSAMQVWCSRAATRPAAVLLPAPG